MTVKASHKFPIGDKEYCIGEKSIPDRMTIKQPRQILLFFLIIYASISAGQERYSPPGTKISIELIPGKREVSENFSIIREVNRYQMLFVEVQQPGFAEKMQLIDSASYSRRGAAILEQREFFVDGYRAKMLRARSNDPESNEISLLFGDDAFYVVVTVRYLTGEKNLLEHIVRSLKSIRYDKQKKPDWKTYNVIKPDATNPFKLLEKESSSVKTIFVRNGDTRAITEDFDDSYIWLQQFVYAEDFLTSEKIILSHLPDYMSSSKITLDKIVFDGLLAIDGVETYRFVADCKKGAEKIQLNVLAAITDGYAIYLFAMSKNQADNAEIEKFILNLKFKTNVYYAR